MPVVPVPRTARAQPAQPCPRKAWEPPRRRLSHVAECTRRALPVALRVEHGPPPEPDPDSPSLPSSGTRVCCRCGQQGARLGHLMSGRRTLGSDSSTAEDDYVQARDPGHSRSSRSMPQGAALTVSTQTRVAFRFDGELDDIPIDAAAAAAKLAHALLQHSDKHEGRPAAMRLARWGPLLNLWVSDPECSPTCLRGSGPLPAGRLAREFRR
jgi:hypothetical protein